GLLQRRLPRRTPRPPRRALDAATHVSQRRSENESLAGGAALARRLVARRARAVGFALAAAATLRASPPRSRLRETVASHRRSASRRHCRGRALSANIVGAA